LYQPRHRRRRDVVVSFLPKDRRMSVVEYSVRSCPGKRAFISGPGDFDLGAGRPVESSRMFDPDVSPYCFDFANRRLLCVSTPDISGAVFFYQAQREHARSVIEVPLDSLPDGPASPALIFSIGRCGSTLLVKAIEAAGVSAVSEPDFYTQAACEQARDASLRRALAGATRLLRYPVIKLRMECINAPLLIAGAFAAPRVMFILREPVAWAASLRRLSRNSLDLGWAVAQLRKGLLALDELARNYAVRVCYYEDFRELRADYVADVLSWAGLPGTVAAETLRGLASRDAQEGTIVSRASVRDVPDDMAFREAFSREWSRWRPVEQIARLRLKLV
jgi:hypothetical protein